LTAETEMSFLKEFNTFGIKLKPWLRIFTWHCEAGLYFCGASLTPGPYLKMRGADIVGNKRMQRRIFDLCPIILFLEVLHHRRFILNLRSFTSDLNLIWVTLGFVGLELFSVTRVGIRLWSIETIAIVRVNIGLLLAERPASLHRAPWRAINWLNVFALIHWVALPHEGVLILAEGKMSWFEVFNLLVCLLLVQITFWGNCSLVSSWDLFFKSSLMHKISALVLVLKGDSGVLVAELIILNFFVPGCTCRVENSWAGTHAKIWLWKSHFLISD
jgi:hypothetical protein